MAQDTMKKGREKVVVMAPHHGEPHTIRIIAIHRAPKRSERNPAKRFAS